jgi:hypothetical protein
MVRRWALASVAAVNFATAAPGSNVQSVLPTGVYEGGYVCAQGTTALRLTVRPPAGGQQTARFDFGGNDGLPRGAYLVTVRLDGNGDIALAPLRWLDQPTDYEMVGARLRQNGPELVGTITDPACDNIALRRVG